MSSKTSVANEALRAIGERRVNSIDADVKAARAVRDVMDIARRESLKVKNKAWKFALRRVKLAQSSITPEFEYSYYYPLPADYLHIHQIAGDALMQYRFNDGHNFYQIESHPTLGKVVVSSSSDIYLRYIADVDDINLMDPLFLNVWSLTIASKICMELTSSFGLLDRVKEDHRKMLNRAATMGSLEDSPPKNPVGFPNSWEAAYQQGF